jgi:uracil-DNA glycosylase
LKDIKVVLLGQDCYINSVNIKDSNGQIVSVPQAMGYAFSVPDGVPPPPSLKVMYKELIADPDVTFDIPLNSDGKPNGNLTKWATEENIFLFNCALTVRERKSNSHAKFWEYFSDSLIKYISDNTEHVVFLLFGAFAQGKSPLIDGHKHCIIKAGHPSPLNTTYPFIGSHVFSKTNIYLRSIGREPVDWNNL